MLNHSDCPFCLVPKSRILSDNAIGFIIRDGFPISPGHTLIIPRRHISSFFNLTVEERSGLMELLDTAKQEVDASHAPDGYNIGINDGPVAGQTVPHMHIHLIPRYRDDQPDPRGGVRWIFPSKAKYWD